MDKLTNDQIASADLPDWRKLAQALHARYVAVDAAAACAFVAALGQMGERIPEVRLSGSVVDLTVATRQEGIWVTPSDLERARAISVVAGEYRLRSVPGDVTQLEIALDTADHSVLSRFWSVVFTGVDQGGGDEVFDPTSRVPAMWFQPTSPHDEPRQRWHFDLWLAPEVAQERITMAVAVGGIVVDDSAAPSFTVLADADGNRVCICTSLDRA